MDGSLVKVDQQQIDKLMYITFPRRSYSIPTWSVKIGILNWVRLHWIPSWLLICLVGCETWTELYNLTRLIGKFIEIVFLTSKTGIFEKFNEPCEPWFNLTNLKTVDSCHLLLKTEKYYSKIIFKYINNTIGPNFKVVFTVKSTCGSYE